MIYFLEQKSVCKYKLWVPLIVLIHRRSRIKAEPYRTSSVSNIGHQQHWHPLRKSVNRFLRSADTDSKKKLQTLLRAAESTCDC